MLKTVATFTSPWEAYIAKGRLEAEGIPAFIAHEHHVWAGWIYSQALGGVKIQVAEERVAAAERIIAEHLEGAYEEALPEDERAEPMNPCPRCGSQRIESRYPWHIMAAVLLTLGLFMVIWPPRRENHACADCGHRWRY